MNFQGMNVVITGGSSGIGKATAKLLAKQGADVFIIARDQEKLNRAIQEIEIKKVSHSQRFGGFSADVKSYKQVVSAIEAIVKDVGPPEILINSAGITHPGYFEKLPLNIFREIMETNYFGTLHTIRAVLPSMITQRNGYIVNVSSLAGVIGVFGYTAYGASKFAVCGFSEALRSELKPYNIKVSVVLPPDTDTPQLREENKIKPYETRFISGNVKPLTPEKVAKEILKGIGRGKYLIIPDRKSRLIYRFQCLSSSLVHWYIDRLVVRARDLKAKSGSNFR